MASFLTNRSLLNPKFEGYKLSPLTQEEHVAIFPLRSSPTQANVSGKTRTPLSFEEVQSRITHNHLAIAHDGQSALYVDNNFNVNRVSINTALLPNFKVVSELPRPIQSAELVQNVHREYPSAVSLPGGSWLVSDGTGLLYVLSNEGETARISATYQLPSDGSIFIPFRIHLAHLDSSDAALCILSSRHVGESGIPAAHDQTKSGSPQFDIWAVTVSLDASSDVPRPLNVIWHGRGNDVPIHVEYDEPRAAFFILGSSRYRQIHAPVPPSYEPAKDELAPIPRAGEDLQNAPLKPPPYSWTQTPDSVTVAFPLPSNVSKSSIKVTLTAKTLSLLIKHELPTSTDLPRYSLKQLWDNINPASSFWTWDRDADKHVGLLTLHLDKKHEGTRWSHVFTAAGTASADPSDAEVPETLDPSELHNIREALEKYTSALQTGEDASGLGLGQGIPSLAEGERDDSVDGAVGRRFSVTWVGADGAEPGWAATEGVASYLLSTPVPGLRADKPTLVVRSDIDGLLFSLPPVAEAPLIRWEHMSTFPALAFVLASKRDTRFTFHLSSEAVFAFESGSGIGGGNVYIYRGTTNKEIWAKQAILKVSGGSSGALLGVGTVKKPDGGFVLLCLCERELVIVKDIV
ncbi:hypothetical protein DFH11DRAFT_1689007 [Phellopilus nigrolimitatus]|nr:hypothetical protein DFH11DRAFT_1689007 [Phellopilus nigrolimitatus]